MPLPKDAKDRKSVPLYRGLVKYFPDALCEVAALSAKANEQHNPGSEIHWDRSKSTDELDALLRHVFEAGTLDDDGIRHSAKVAWRALANLQKEIEASRPTQKEDVRSVINEAQAEQRARVGTPWCEVCKSVINEAQAEQRARADTPWCEVPNCP